ncbi:MAG: hypothetical protein H6835_10355 [Planctomycetes bacterium]|nr:hypothetical protein [Planctomycetota bacterium]
MTRRGAVLALVAAALLLVVTSVAWLRLHPAVATTTVVADARALPAIGETGEPAVLEGELELAPRDAVSGPARNRHASEPFPSPEVAFVVAVVEGAPADCSVRVVIAPLEVSGDVALVGGCGEVRLPAVSGIPLVVRGEVLPERGGVRFFLEPTPVQVEPGTEQTVRLRVAQGHQVVVRVHGPSASLRSSLVVEAVAETDGLADDDRAVCPTGDDGCARFVLPAGRYHFVCGSDLEQVALRRRDGAALVVPIEGDAVLDVEPVEQLAGFQVRDAGRVVSHRMQLRGLLRRFQGPPPTECSVVARSRFQTCRGCWVATERRSVRWLRTSDLQWVGDVTTVDLDDDDDDATLRVVAELPGDCFASLAVAATSLSSGAAASSSGNTSPFELRLAPGDYHLAWRCSGAPGPVIATLVRLAPGEVRLLYATPPTLQPWTVLLRDLPTLGIAGQSATACVGEGWALGCQADGVVPFLMQSSPSTETAASLRALLLKVAFPARISAIDGASRTFEVCHGLTAADIVHVSSRGLGDGERRIELRSELADMPMPAQLPAGFDLPMVPGSERRGCLIEKVDGVDQVTAWFSARHGAHELLVEPRGHWATVRIGLADAQATVSIDGDSGMDPIAVAWSHGPGELRVFVADGTTAVHVDMQPGGRFTFAPAATEMVAR